MSTSMEAVNVIWVLGCTICVFLMQAGFCCLEAGMVRSKNSINVAIKNVADLCVAVPMFWLVGYGLMFGHSFLGFLGTSGFASTPSTPLDTAILLFQMAFCGTVITIVSGAVAERMKFGGYLIVSLVLSGVIYPIAGHWAWGSLVSTESAGWLEQIGFIDFAGSGVVHAIGGCVGLAAIVIIGPRRGRFEGAGADFNGHNLPMSALGLLLLWVGWFGFNGGSVLRWDNSVPQILVNTMMGAASGGAAAMLLACVRSQRILVLNVQNGVLAGLVSFTASCHVLSVPAATLSGAIGCVVALGTDRVLQRFRIDDVVKAVPVHAVAGIWGLLSVALLGNSDAWGTGLSRLEQFIAQITGAAAIVLWSFSAGYVFLNLVNRFYPLRVSHEAERLGLNVSEHGASYELLDLMNEMDEQRRRGDFSQPVSVASHSEVGQVAAQYNRVLATVNKDREELVSARNEAKLSAEHVTFMNNKMEKKVAELEQFNELAVGRELRMIDLKQEVNDLLSGNGKPEKYETDSDLDALHSAATSVEDFHA